MGKGKTSGMTKAQIIKAGGAAAVKVMDCSEILACFDPEITFGSHSDMQGSLEHVEAYNAKTGAGYQAEHVPPCSTLHVSGRGGALFGAVKGTLYSTGQALTPSCDPCAGQVCGQDSFCCDTQWDSICVSEVGSICGQTCP